MNVIGDVERADLHHPGRHHRHGRARSRRPRTALKDGGRRRACSAARCTVSCRVRRSSESSKLGARRADRDEHDPDDGRARQLHEDSSAVDCPAPRSGDSEHSRGNLGVLIVCVGGETVGDCHSRSELKGSSANGRKRLRGSIMDATLQAQNRSDEGRTRRAASRAPAGFRRWSTAPSPAAPEATVSVTVDPKALSRILHSESGANTIISLELDGFDDAGARQGFPAAPCDACRFFTRTSTGSRWTAS